MIYAAPALCYGTYCRYSAPDAADLLDAGEGDGPDNKLNAHNWDFCEACQRILNIFLFVKSSPMFAGWCPEMYTRM